MDDLYCSLCLHAKTGVADKAVTIINGHAVCYDHTGYVQGESGSLALATVLKEEGK